MRHTPQRSPRKRPTVGAGSSQREDSPAHPASSPSPCVYHALRKPPTYVDLRFLQQCGTLRWLGRALATLGTSPTKIPMKDGIARITAVRHVATNAPSHSRRRPEYTSATRTRRGLALRAEVATHFPRGMSASRPRGMACGAAPSAAPCADS